MVQSSAPGFLDDYSLSHFWAAEPVRSRTNCFLTELGEAISTHQGKDRSMLLRVKEDHDGAETSGNSVSVINWHLRLKETVRSSYDKYAHKCLAVSQAVFEMRLKDVAVAVPLLCCAAYMLSVASRKQIVLVDHHSSAEFEDKLVAAHVSFDPNRTGKICLLYLYSKQFSCKMFDFNGGLKRDVPDLEEPIVLDGVGHFLNQEVPQEIDNTSLHSDILIILKTLRKLEADRVYDPSLIYQLPKEYLVVARQHLSFRGNFIIGRLADCNTVLRNGPSSAPGFLDDYCLSHFWAAGPLRSRFDLEGSYDKYYAHKCSTVSQAVFETRLKDMAVAVPLMCCAADMLSVASHKPIVLVGHYSSAEFEDMLVAAHASFDPNRTVYVSHPLGNSTKKQANGGMEWWKFVVEDLDAIYYFPGAKEYIESGGLKREIPDPE
ncbi:hypothetical protein RJ641_030464 [Dillenia turbinata]|uniref:Uncharacterized protein n=1 Tax=Dillenia turbinata TaxID=194707 RepID=A0AAN8W6N7_9MAGN